MMAHKINEWDAEHSTIIILLCDIGLEGRSRYTRRAKRVLVGEAGSRILMSEAN